MSWQADRAVPLLAGEAFCEKPPMTYWLAALPIRMFGTQAWAARLPNVLYALLSAWAVGILATRSVGKHAGLAAAAAIGSFLLAYQVQIWLATDAPLLAGVAVALLGLYLGFYATTVRARWAGYTLMHGALAFGFLSKSAVAWMVPGLTLLTLIVWERRWRELKRWELYVGLIAQLAIVLAWVWSVYVGPEGPAHLRVFFWNNLVGRFAQVEAPVDLQYAGAHRNFPGKYLLELPVYLFPWTLLLPAALRHAWRARGRSSPDLRALRFALATAVPPLLLLSCAATARNIYYAPALPGIALLIGWWVQDAATHSDRWDVRALRATAVLLLTAIAVLTGALCLVGMDGWQDMHKPLAYALCSAAGLGLATLFVLRAWRHAPGRLPSAATALLLAYATLLIGPLPQLYRQIDTWQNLAGIARQVQADTAARPLLLLAPDETTRAIIDMFARTAPAVVPAPVDASAYERVYAIAAQRPTAAVLTQLPGRAPPQNPRLLGLFQRLGLKFGAPQPPPPWLANSHLKMVKIYQLPNGRRYALLDVDPVR